MTDLLPQQPVNPMLPANESGRLAALHRYQVLDTPAEVSFDRITTLAARLFKIPTVLISLVDKSRAWFKSSIGFGAPEVPRDATICSFAVLSDEPLIVPDTRLDDRFVCNPFVQCEPGMRFYAGAPLIDRDGFNLGTLCLLDSVPHDPLTAEQEATLVDLAAMVVDELELRLAAQQIARVDAALVEITQGVSRVTGGAFFDELVRHFAKVLGTDYVYIGLVEGHEPKMLRTIATCDRGKIVENLEYRLADTPCWEAIEQRKICCHPRNVQARFPNAPLLKPLAVDSYIAIPFYAADGSVLGILGVMDGKPLEQLQLAESLLTIFASRIATELDRQQHELMLVEQTRLLEAVSTGQPLSECLSSLCSSLAKLSPNMRACVLLSDDRRSKFPRSITPDFPPSLSQGFKDAPIRELADGTCGTAVYSGEPVTCADIANDDRWSQSWRDLCLAHGIRACYSFPIIGSDNLPLGSLMLCFSEARLPTDREDRVGEFGTKIASITIDRKRSIENLSESEERLNLALAAADMATWDADLSTGKTIWSAKQFQILGYDPVTDGAATVEMWLSLVHPDDLAAVTQAWEIAQRERSLFCSEYRLVRADSGRVVWVAATGQFLENQAGAAMRSVGVMFDISDRKIAELKNHQLNRDLAFQAEELQTILDALPVGVAIADDPHCNVIRTNQFGQNMLKVSPDTNVSATGAEAETLPFRQYHNGRELLGDQLPMQLATAQGQAVRDVEIQMVRADGAAFDWLVTAVPLFDEHHAVRGCVATFTDVTELKRLQSQLRLREAELTEAQRIGKIGNWYLDTQTDVTTGSDELARIYGFDPRDTLPNFAAQAGWLYSHESWQQLNAEVQRSLDTGIGYELDLPAFRNDGMPIWITTRSEVVRDPAGTIVGLRGTVQDITERKQTEQEILLYRERLEFVLNNTGIGLWLNSLPLGALNWDDRTRELFFVPPDAEATIDLFWSRVHPDDREPTRLAVEAALREGTLYEIDHRAVHPNTGEIRWIRSAGKATYAPDGAPISFDGINYDITERQVATANLAQSNARFESAMLAVRGMVYEWNLQTKTIYRSKGLFELLGYRPEDVPPTNDWWMDRVHPDDLERTQSEFLAAPVGIARFESEYRVRHAAGHWVYVSDRSYFQYDSHGQMINIVGFTTDITERKRTEEELHQSQLLVQRQLMEIEAIYQTAPIGLTILDRDLRYVRLNQRLAEINGIDIDDHIGRTLREIVPSVADEDEPILNSIFTTGEPLLNIEISGETLAQPGVQRTWIQNCYPLRDETGQIAGINVVVQEITDRKRAEAELRESEERFRTLADNITQFAWMTDENGWIFWYNRRWFEYTGTTLEQMQGWGWQSVHHPEHIDRVVKLFRHHLEIGEEWEDIFPLRGRDGAYRWFLSRAVPIRDESGQIRRWFGTNTDITDLQQAEAELAERNKELDSFVHTVSHDLKAPLRAISNLSVWIEEDLDGQLPPDSQQQFQLLRTRVKRMESMIDSLLLYARAGRQEAQLETFDLAELLSEIIDSLAPPEGFTIDIQQPLPTLTTKRVFLSQVFANLISNAINHHTSVTGHLHISAIEHPDCHEFIIKDDGPGIAPEHHEKVFAIFQTLKVQDNSDSTGIGLAIVKKIVETEQGTIRLESSLGRGTTFYVTWPKNHQ